MDLKPWISQNNIKKKDFLLILWWNYTNDIKDGEMIENIVINKGLNTYFVYF